MTSTGGMERQTSLFWQQHFQNESEDDQDEDDEARLVSNSDGDDDNGSKGGSSGCHPADDDCGSKGGDDDDLEQQQGGTRSTGTGPTTTTTTTTAGTTSQDCRLQSKQREVAARNSVSSTLLQAEKRLTSYPMVLLPPDSVSEEQQHVPATTTVDEEEGSAVDSPAVLLVVGGGGGSNDNTRRGSSLLELQHEKLTSQGLSASSVEDANEGATRTSGRGSGLSSYLPYLRSGDDDDDSPPPKPGATASLVSQILGGTTDLQPLPEMMNIRRGPGAHSVGAGFRVGVPLVEAGNGGGGESASELVEEEASGTNANYNNNNEGLAEALPVSEYFPSMEAMPVDKDQLDQLQALKEAKEKRYKRSICGLVVVVAFLALVLSLSLGGQQSGNDNAVVDTTTTETPTPSPTRPLPPMENLELLYYNLPENTKESLYDIASPQYEAWEWLLNHPNLSAYPEWRKKQVFGMATFFYALEGPNWPEETPGYSRWMNTSISECDWVLTDAEVQFWATVSTIYLGPNAHEPGDFQPCNSDGELQTLMVQKLFLPNTDITPFIPPEIELLSSSLEIFGILTSQFHAKLSDLLIPEVIQLSNLQSILFYGNGVMSGTIPMETISQISGLRHLLISSNKLTGTISPQIGRMTSLEHLMLDDLLGVTGTLPSELGLMTSLTALEIYRSSVTGTIPTELGSLSNNSLIYLDGNRLTGAIPTQLGLNRKHPVGTCLDGTAPSSLPNADLAFL